MNANINRIKKGWTGATLKSTVEIRGGGGLIGLFSDRKRQFRRKYSVGGIKD